MPPEAGHSNDDPCPGEGLSAWAGPLRSLLWDSLKLVRSLPPLIPSEFHQPDSEE